MNQARAIKHDHHHDCCSASSGPRPIADAPEGAIWTCPMHPEIQQVGPGNCPICGMALEPMEPSLDEGPNPELVDFTRRLKVAAVLAVPLLFLAMGAEMLGLGMFRSEGRRVGKGGVSMG